MAILENYLEEQPHCSDCNINLVDNSWELYPYIKDGKARCGSCDTPLPYLLAVSMFPELEETVCRICHEKISGCICDSLPLYEISNCSPDVENMQDIWEEEDFQNQGEPSELYPDGEN